MVTSKGHSQRITRCREELEGMVKPETDTVLKALTQVQRAVQCNHEEQAR